MMAITLSDGVSVAYGARHSPAKNHFRMIDRILYCDTVSLIQSHLDGFHLILSVRLFIYLVRLIFYTLAWLANFLITLFY